MAAFAPPTTFFELGLERPSLNVGSVRLVDIWPTMRAALANYYDRDPASFRTFEAIWANDNESAELVTLGGRIVGALDRPITEADIAAFWGVDRMEKRAFMNRIRSLSNIDGDQLPELTREEQSAFLRDPVRFFLRANEIQSDAIMREIEARQITRVNEAKPAPHASEINRKPSKPMIAKASKKKPKARIDGQRELLLPITGGAVKRDVQAGAPLIKRNAG